MVPSSMGAVGLASSDTATTTQSSNDVIEPGGSGRPDAAGNPKVDHLVYVRESYVYIRISHIFFKVFKIQNLIPSPQTINNYWFTFAR